MRRERPTINSMRGSRLSTEWVLILVLSIWLWPLAGLQAYEKVYLSPQEALRLLFSDSERVRSEEKKLSAAERRHLEQELGYTLARDSYTFYLGQTADHIDGYALIDHQVGKTRPITYIVKISPQGTVEQIEVLVYRESHGSEVRHPRFLKQFQGKGRTEAPRLERDITNISGATLSVRAITIGVQRALALWHHSYGPAAK